MAGTDGSSSPFDDLVDGTGALDLPADTTRRRRRTATESRGISLGRAPVAAAHNSERTRTLPPVPLEPPAQTRSGDEPRPDPAASGPDLYGSTPAAPGPAGPDLYGAGPRPP